MSLGIGEYCKICGDQLDYGVGFDLQKKVCNTCLRLIPKVLDYLNSQEKP